MYPQNVSLNPNWTLRAGRELRTLPKSGLVFTPAGFGNWFREQCDIAGLRHCSAHGLRKAAARRLAEAGCTAHEIAAITGHASLNEVQRYTRAVDQQKLAAAAMEKTRTFSGQPYAGLAKKRKRL